METTRQQEARKRNWTILRLRGLYHQVPFDIPTECYRAIRSNIDDALTKLGAEPEAERKGRIHDAIVRGDMEEAVKIRSFRGIKNK